MKALQEFSCRINRAPPLDRLLDAVLETIESIYQKVHDRSSVVRMELLEWIVIILIAFEIVSGFWRY